MMMASAAAPAATAGAPRPIDIPLPFFAKRFAHYRACVHSTTHVSRIWRVFGPPHKASTRHMQVESWTFSSWTASLLLDQVQQQQRAPLPMPEFLELVYGPTATAATSLRWIKLVKGVIRIAGRKLRNELGWYFLRECALRGLVSVGRLSPTDTAFSDSEPDAAPPCPP